MNGFLLVSERERGSKEILAKCKREWKLEISSRFSQNLSGTHDLYRSLKLSSDAYHHVSTEYPEDIIKKETS